MLKYCFATAALISAAQGAAWNYNDLGDDWGKLNSICDDGTQQSPIDITKRDTQLSSDIKIVKGPYKNFVGSSAINMIDKGYTIQANFPGGIEGGTGGFTRTFFGGEVGEFKALQMHVHAPSEHTVNGYHYDLELHIVHLFADGTLGGVIGVFFDRKMGGDKENAFIQQLISPEPTASPGSSRNINLNAFMAQLDTSKFWAYPGSLTTPPCTEGIKWNVMMEVQSLSTAQQ